MGGAGWTSSKASKISMLGWWMVQTTVRPVLTVFRTVRITMAAARASNPLVGSSMKIMDGLATSSTAMVNLFLCSVDNPLWPGNPTSAFRNGTSSTSSITSSTNFCSASKKRVLCQMRIQDRLVTLQIRIGWRNIKLCWFGSANSMVLAQHFCTICWGNL